MILLFILALIVSLSSSYRCSYTGIQKPTNFQWKASVNTSSGIASSTETSLVYVPSYQPTSCGDSSITGIPSTGLKKFQLKVKKLFESYPHYISSGRVSLGLLCSSNSIKLSRNKDEDCNLKYHDSVPTGQCSNIISLRDRFLSINLLQFGECKSTFINTSKRTELVCEIPIVGGLLAYKGRSENEESSLPREFGALQFKLIKKALEMSISL